MADDLIFDVDDQLMEQLRERAGQNGRSVEEEVVQILRSALDEKELNE